MRSRSGPTSTRATLAALSAAHPVSDDAFDDIIRHLAQVHPSRYIRLLARARPRSGSATCAQLTDQSEALRFVAFVDRAYDAQIPILATGRAAGPGVQRGDARRRVPQEVPARDLAAQRAVARRASEPRQSPRPSRILSLSNGQAPLTRCSHTGRFL